MVNNPLPRPSVTISLPSPPTNSLDNLLSYQTQKTVIIKDRKLGFFYYILLLIAICWVVGYQILYGNEHFRQYDVQGNVRMSLQQPTVDGCNPNKKECLDDYKSMKELEYCKQYDGKQYQYDKKNIDEPKIHQRNCIFLDQHELLPLGMLDDKMFIATRVDTHVEKQSCFPNEENGWKCKKKYEPVMEDQEETGQEEEGSESDSESKTKTDTEQQLSEIIRDSSGNQQDQNLKFTDSISNNVTATAAVKGTKDNLIFKVKDLLKKNDIKKSNQNQNLIQKQTPKSESSFIADIESFTILLAHTYHRGGIHGNNLYHQGFYEVCVDAKTRATLPIHVCEGKSSFPIQDVMMLKKFLEFESQGREAVLELRPINCIKKGLCHFSDDYGDGRDDDDDGDGGHNKTDSGLDSLTSNSDSSESGESTSTENFLAIDDTGRKLDVSEEIIDIGSDTHTEKPHRKDVFALPSGDVFRLSKLLELSGINLDHNLNIDKKSRRESGTLLEIQVEYTNLHPWISTFGEKKIGYKYRVTERPIEEVKTESYGQGRFLSQPKDFPLTRIIENRHGVYLRVSVSGVFGFFNVVYLLIMLTTSLTLIAGAAKIVDLFALYLVKGKEIYWGFKYEEVDANKEVYGN